MADPRLRALWHLFGRPAPARNDCGSPVRYEHEDWSRSLGWGPEPGEGACDYPSPLCPLLVEGRCPFWQQKGAS